MESVVCRMMAACATGRPSLSVTRPPRRICALAPCVISSAARRVRRVKIVLMMNRLMGVNLFRGKGEGAIRAGCLSPTYEVLLSLIGPQSLRSGGLFLSVRWQSDVFQMLRRTFWRLRNFRKRLGELFGVCGTSASVSESFLAFAGVPQVSQRTFWRLRNFRKCLGELFGVCGNPASVSKNFLAFAGIPQVSRRTFWRLREPRKCLEELFGVCGNPASVSKNFLAFAGVPQAFPKALWPLRHAVRDMLYE